MWCKGGPLSGFPIISLWSKRVPNISRLSVPMTVSWPSPATPIVTRLQRELRKICRPSPECAVSVQSDKPPNAYMIDEMEAKEQITRCPLVSSQDNPSPV